MRVRNDNVPGGGGGGTSKNDRIRTGNNSPPVAPPISFGDLQKHNGSRLEHHMRSCVSSVPGYKVPKYSQSWTAARKRFVHEDGDEMANSMLVSAGTVPLVVHTPARVLLGENAILEDRLENSDGVP